MIKVLLVEDDPAKKSRLLGFLSARKGELFDTVDTALSVGDALSHLKRTSYDLLIVDVILPAVLGGAVQEENSMELLGQIDEGAGVHRPRFSVAISAAKQLSKKATDFFIGRPWGILRYSDSSNECLATLEKIARYIINGVEKPVNKNCDVFLLTALMDPEFSALETMPIAWQPLEPMDEMQFVRFGMFQTGSREISVAAAFAPRMGSVSAAILAAKAAIRLNPKLLLVCGICAGIPGKVAIGDVVAADISWDWQSGKYVDKEGQEQFEIAPDQIAVDERTRSQLLLLKRDREFWESLGALSSKFLQKAPKLVIGPLATGSAVLADARVAERIQATQHRGLTGLDMEVYGVYAALRACNAKTSFVALKSVCDMGDKKKNDEFQLYAAEVSARTTLHFLKNFAGPILDE